jgi:hypothetical protein
VCGCEAKRDGENCEPGGLAHGESFRG